MVRVGRTLLGLSSIAIASVAAPLTARAQSCLGHPAFPTGRVNLSTDIAVGSDFGGLGVDLNAGNRKSGPFAGVGVGVDRFVTDPKETRLNLGGLIGWEHYNKDQLIWCPVASASYVRGSEVDQGAGPQHTTQTQFGAGLAVGFELDRRGRLSFNPFVSARVTRLTDLTHTATGDTKFSETGTTFGFGLGIRINEAIQITPSMNGSSFAGANLVFDLRFSVALQLKKS